MQRTTIPRNAKPSNSEQNHLGQTRGWFAVTRTTNSTWQTTPWISPCIQTVFLTTIKRRRYWNPPTNNSKFEQFTRHSSSVTRVRIRQSKSHTLITRTFRMPRAPAHATSHSKFLHTQSIYRIQTTRESSSRSSRNGMKSILNLNRIRTGWSRRYSKQSQSGMWSKKPKSTFSNRKWRHLIS